MASWPKHVSNPARPLTAREREILAFLLSVDTAGIQELRQQVDRALAVPWDCGCASIDLVVDRDTAPPSAFNGVIESHTVQKHDPKRRLDLIVWIGDGFLTGVEIADHVEPHGKFSKVFPPASGFDPPHVRDDV